MIAYYLLRHTCVFLFFVLPLLLVSPFVTAIALLYTKPDDNKLPDWAKWFDNADHEGDGLNGYYGWREEHPNYTDRYVRWLWLLRNPINYVSVKILSRPYLADRISEYKTTIQKVGNNDYSGLRYTTTVRMFELYYVKNYGNGRCLRVRIGWKIGEQNETQFNELCSWVFVISPFVTFKGVV